MEGNGLRAEGEFLAFIWLVSITTGNSRVALVVSGCWTSFLMVIFTFKYPKVEVWFQLECAPEQLVSMVTVNWHFLCCHVFPVVSELDYLPLEHVVFNDDLEFCFWDMSRQGTLDRFLVID